MNDGGKKIFNYSENASMTTQSYKVVRSFSSKRVQYINGEAVNVNLAAENENLFSTRVIPTDKFNPSTLERRGDLVTTKINANQAEEIRKDFGCMKRFLYTQITDENNDDSNKLLFSPNIMFNNEESDCVPQVDISTTKYPKGTYHPSSSSISSNETHSSLSRLDQIIGELIQTEAAYIRSLDVVVKEYIPYLELMENIDKHSIIEGIFGNISSIYDQSKLFYDELKQSNYEYEVVGNTFIKHETLFQLYLDYIKNRKYSEELVTEYEETIQEKERLLDDGKDLSSRLLAPIQRLTKYKLLMQSLYKELAKNDTPAASVKKALNIIETILKKCDDYEAFDAVRYSPINLERNAGSFIRSEKFRVLTPRSFESVVFLFEDIIIFTVASQRNSKEFIYIDGIPMMQLEVARIGDNGTPKLNLTNYVKCKEAGAHHFTYTIVPNSVQSAQLWVDYINKRLWRQLKDCKDSKK